MGIGKAVGIQTQVDLRLIFYLCKNLLIFDIFEANHIILMRILFFYCFALLCTSLVAQQQPHRSSFFQNDKKTFTFWDHSAEEPVTIINDTLWLKGFDMQAQRIPPFSSNTSLHVFKKLVVLDTTTYLINNGGGEILQYNQDSLLRIDSSMPHKNQFGGVVFPYQNNFYHYGGYGLFTNKNILIRYDKSEGDWYLVHTGAKKPKPGYAIGRNIDNYLYVICPLNPAANDTNTSNTLSEIYRFDFTTNNWQYVGTTNLQLRSNSSTYTYGDFLYVKGKNGVLYEIDFVANTYRTYSSNKRYFSGDYSQLFHIDPVTNTLYFRSADNQQRMIYKKLSAAEFKSQLIATDVLVAENSSFYLLASLGLLLLFLTPVLYKKNKVFPGLVYVQKYQIVKFKGRELLMLEPLEKKVLLFLIERMNAYTLLNDLNDLFLEEGTQLSQAALIKKRDTTLVALSGILEQILNVPQEEILLKKKSDLDKRVKLIRINHKMVRIN